MDDYSSCKKLEVLRSNQSYPLYISPDRTPNERMNDKALLNEMNKRKADGEENLVIRNQCIVKKTDSDTGTLY